MNASNLAIVDFSLVPAKRTQEQVVIPRGQH